MTVSILRTADAWWVHTPSGASRIDTLATTTGGLLADRASIQAAIGGNGFVPADSLQLISPVTAPCRVVAQMANFASHVRDSGMDPQKIPMAFFRKSSGSISGPYDDVVRPGHVRLLDYEAEIGLVIGKELPVGSVITPETFADYVAGLVITNDVSARDLQLPQTQFYESKSYPGFTPTGPTLVLFDADDWNRFGDLRLRLWVNGEVRQDMTVADMIYLPMDALGTLARFQHLSPGDLVLTGTPAGTALSAPPKPIEIISNLLPPATKWRLFFRAQGRNPKYLKSGDVVEIAISTDDGKIDLGRQRTTVRAAR
ncbi:fumarylacetoacetate hydrolase family protein [Arthrobacter sp. ISL-48]|uniref:fumarylacetoacetate hydrolase family protein n=1 Tax=Arthrobacter sp. ISL-48 TaxID=2819110 RepID=UPI001BE9774C|nr:fumarylacetoacetate hydrolase family protein [Arthrobacter sp. ISL-48]MBT2534515.1 fumarylacetoacetate hydrolase family protein [Arthrobacter sp. ISL-48]